MAVLGVAIILGIMIPNYVNETKDPFDTGKQNLIVGTPDTHSVSLHCTVEELASKVLFS